LRPPEVGVSLPGRHIGSRQSSRVWGSKAPGLEEQGDRSVDLSNKRVIAIGERDGIQGEVIRDVATELGADVVFTITQCFV
jgi:glycine reductase